MKTVTIESNGINDGIAGVYLTESGTDDPKNWTWRDCGNGPEVVNKEVIFGPYESEQKAIECNLSLILIRRFGGWIETGDGNLLEDGGLVIDLLSDDFGREVLEKIKIENWQKAWEDFNREVGEE